MCNLRCKYCYYLPTLDRLGKPVRRMSAETLEAVLGGFLPHAGDVTTIAWQGGEPTLAGLAFFRRAFELQKCYTREGQRVTHALQTNGTLLDDAWCSFLHENEVLVGLSLDGLASVHDEQRVQPDGRSGSHHQVLGAIALLQKHDVQFNLLTVLHRDNLEEPEALLSYMVQLGGKWLQMIPATDWRDGREAAFNPPPEAYGRFLCQLFDGWFDRYRDDVSVRIFDSFLLGLVHGQSGECTFGPSCQQQLTVEHNGDVYGCDHFVEPKWKLGAVRDAQWMDSLDGDRFTTFAQQKQNVPDTCRVCKYWHLCFGGCPKHRHGRGEQPAASTLCEAYRMLFDHSIDRLTWLAGYIRQGQGPPSIKQIRRRSQAHHHRASPSRTTRYKRRKSR